jgi:hypothetical protein
MPRRSIMIWIASIGSRNCGSLRSAFQLVTAALCVFVLLGSTNTSHACAKAETAAAHAQVMSVIVQPSEIVLAAKSVGGVQTVSARAVDSGSALSSHCCDSRFSQCGGDRCSKGCCAAGAPAALASHNDVTFIEPSCSYLDRAGPAVFYSVFSIAFRPPRTIA